MIFIMGLGSGGIDSGLNTFISQRGTARQINWLHAAFGIGATTGPFLAAGVQAAGGAWTWNFALVAAFVSVIILLVWRTAPYWQIEASSKKGEGPAVSGQAKFMDSLRLPVVWVSTILFFFYVGTELTAGQWSFSLFTLGRGIPDLAAKFWVGIYWGIFTLGRVLFGLVADRVPLNSFLRGALAASAAGAMLLLWNPLPEIGFAGLVLMGLAQAPIFPSLIVSTISRVGRDHAPNAIGFQVAAGGIGGTTITSLVGVLASSLGLETIAVSIVVLALLTLLAHEFVLLISARHIPATPHYAR
jgi:fucose permease